MKTEPKFKVGERVQILGMYWGIHGRASTYGTIEAIDYVDRLDQYGYVIVVNCEFLPITVYEAYLRKPIPLVEILDRL